MSLNVINKIHIGLSILVRCKSVTESWVIGREISVGSESFACCILMFIRDNLIKKKEKKTVFRK